LVQREYKKKKKKKTEIYRRFFGLVAPAPAPGFAPLLLLLPFFKLSQLLLLGP
jgi:hypothetical protein